MGKDNFMFDDDGYSGYQKALSCAGWLPSLVARDGVEGLELFRKKSVT